MIEVLLTVVIVGVTFTALFASLATAGNAGNAGRTSVQADAVLRNYAEAAKLSAQSCVYPGTYTVVVPPVPAGYTPTISGGNVQPCPAVGVTQVLQLTVVGPLGITAKMQIKVRTP